MPTEQNLNPEFKCRSSAAHVVSSFLLMLPFFHRSAVYSIQPENPENESHRNSEHETHLPSTQNSELRTRNTEKGQHPKALPLTKTITGNNSQIKNTDYSIHQIGVSLVSPHELSIR
ncbi:hypothetical protein DFO77_1422 [Marinilabilia salmonicolor]|uniref:Uncharacterized protein n=1 Tax=Marinilabilia salmonicolor TaxID=989 RepID=A0A368UKE3_9BACT|nr:hypothetical protein DFO77_1422 [Marinilabilia salmonicolor]